jgi:hypothetical protein
MLSMLACMASLGFAREIDRMDWRKLLHVCKSRPYSVGALMGIPLGIVVWMLFVNRHPLGLLYVALMVVFTACWFRNPIYRMSAVAWFVGLTVAIFLLQYTLFTGGG